MGDRPTAAGLEPGNGHIRADLRCDVVRADVIGGTIDALYAVGLYLAATAESTEGAVATRLENAVREVDKVVRTLQGSVTHARAAALAIDIDEVIAAMTFVDRGVRRLAINAPTGTGLTSSLVDAEHAARWTLRSLEDVRRTFHGNDSLGGSS